MLSPTIIALSMGTPKTVGCGEEQIGIRLCVPDLIARDYRSVCMIDVKRCEIGRRRWPLEAMA